MFSYNLTVTMSEDLLLSQKERNKEPRIYMFVKVKFNGFVLWGKIISN